MISDMDGYEGVDEDTTASEQREGDTIDDRTRREQPQRVRVDTSVDIVDDDGDDGVDREKDSRRPTSTPPRARSRPSWLPCTSATTRPAWSITPTTT